MTKELTTIEDVGVTALVPADVLDSAKVAATALMGVMEQKKRKVIINNEQYLEYEDWQTLGQFYGVAVMTKDAELVEIDGVKGAKAKADIINLKTGLIIGSAEAYCLRDEENWQDKPWFQLASMAQTRAGAKALRNRLAWIAVLGGFRPTPAEEMEGTQQKGHWCPVHKTVFFKKGKMPGYAHKVEGTGEWCNEEDFAPSLTDAPQSMPAPVPEESNDNIPEKGEAPTSQDLLYNQIAKQMKWKDLKIVRSWIINKMKIPAERIDSDPQGVWEEIKALQGWQIKS